MSSSERPQLAPRAASPSDSVAVVTSAGLRPIIVLVPWSKLNDITNAGLPPSGSPLPGEPITDFFALDARGVAEHSFHDPERFYVDPATQTADGVATLQANLATLRAVAGDPYMQDPQLRGRLAEVAIPTLVIWGDSDRIASAVYGRAYADSFGDARFELVNEAGHLPQIEQPAATFALIDAFSHREDWATHADRPTTGRPGGQSDPNKLAARRFISS